MTSLLKYTLLTASLAVGTAQAAYITGVTATTDMGSDMGTDISHITDGSGLSALTLTATHVSSGTGNAWVGYTASGTVTFDLHGSYALTDLAVWNFNGLSSAGVNGVQVLTSTDGSAFSALVGGPTQFSREYNFIASAQPFSFGPVTASYVRFDILGNFGESFSGLDEVGFGGTPASASVPEPATLALLVAGLAGFGLRRRAA